VGEWDYDDFLARVSDMHYFVERDRKEAERANKGRQDEGEGDASDPEMRELIEMDLDKEFGDFLTLP
jgi:hypothetical protein